VTERRDDDPEAPVDLSALAGDADVRVARILGRVDERVAAARTGERSAMTLGEAVGRRLARFAIPALVAAAAAVAAVVLTGKGADTERDVFAALVLGSDAAPAAWIAQGRRPEVPELLRMIEGRR